jgi:hypothetical protein
MANYRATFGKKIKFLTSDLSMSTATEGEIFYSDTAKDFKVGVSLTAWSSGPSMNKARQGIMGASAAPATAPPVGPNASGGRAQTEEYDGSSWTEVGDLNTKKFSGAGFGTQTAAIKTGGVDGPYPATRSVNRTESWDGSSWTEVGDLNTARGQFPGIGIATAGLVVGGLVFPSRVGNVESWDGTSWTEVGDLNEGRQETMGLGVYDAALGICGEPGSGTRVGKVEQWDGSSWTEVADVNTIRTDAYHHFGSVTAGLIAGGQNPPNSPNILTNNETWDGSSWTNSPVSLGTARYMHGGAGSTTAAIVFAGRTPSASQAGDTEELADAVTLKTITDS